jgi:type I restriction enzyme, S subunit
MTTPSVPQLRFPQFNKPWVKTKLGDKENQTTFSKGKGISKADITENGKLPCVRYGELYTTYGVLIQDVQSSTDVPEKQLILSDGNEVLIPASGETAIDIATAAVLQQPGVAIGGDINIIKSNIDPVFLAYYLNYKKKEIAKLAQGNSVVHLYSTQLSGLIIYRPALDEQKKISTLLNNIDLKITSMERSISLLEKFKSALLMKVLTQKLELDGKPSKVTWKTVPLKSLATLVTEKNLSNSLSVVLTNSASRGIVNQKDYFDKDIANTNNLDGYYVVRKNDYVYNPRVSSGAPVGPVKKNHLATGLMSPLYSVFRFNETNNDFYELFFQSCLWHSYMRKVANIGVRHDRMNITNSDFMNLPIPTPSTEERNKIVKYFLTLERSIELKKEKLEKIETLKKGLLVKLFI